MRKFDSKTLTIDISGGSTHPQELAEKPTTTGKCLDTTITSALIASTNLTWLALNIE